MIRAGGLDPEIGAQYLAALLHGNRRNCQAIVQNVIDQGISVRDLYVDLFQRSLYRVGELWEQGRVSVATEHLATAITESLLTLIYPRLFEQPHIGRSAIVSCAANEHHQIGGKMVADTFELNGWNGYFLGANTPASELLRLTEEKQPDVLALSLALPSGMDELVRTARSIRSLFPALPIWVGGHAFQWAAGQRVREINGVSVLSGLDELERRLREWPADHG